jgi:hypothetical protein
METVFDLATREELSAVFGEDGPGEPGHPFTNSHDLALLYASRGDFKAADRYLDKIDDQQYRLSCQLLIYERRGDGHESADTNGTGTVLFTAAQ